MSRSRKDILRNYYRRIDKDHWDTWKYPFSRSRHEYYHWRPMVYTFGSPPSNFRRIKNKIRRAQAKQALREGKDPPREYKDIWCDWL